MTITLVEEDVAKLRYEEVYLQELMSRQRLTLNGLVRRSKRIDFTKIQVRTTKLRTPHCIHRIKDTLGNGLCP